MTTTSPVRMMRVQQDSMAARFLHRYEDGYRFIRLIRLKSGWRYSCHERINGVMVRLRGLRTQEQADAWLATTRKVEMARA